MMGVFLLWDRFYIQPKLQKNPVQPIAQSIQPSQAAAVPQKLPEITESLDLGVSEATISNSSKLFNNWTLKNYKVNLKDPATTVGLESVGHQPSGMGDLIFDRPEFLYLSQVQGSLEKTAQGAVLWRYQDQNVSIEKQYTPSSDQKGLVNIDIKVAFKGQAPGNLFVSLSGGSKEKDEDLIDRRLVYSSQKDFSYQELKGDIEQAAIPFPMNWIGVTNRYFLFTLLKVDQASSSGLVQGTSENNGRVMIVYPIQAGVVQAQLKAFFGPKELSLLRGVNPSLERTIDFGWFTVFAYPLLRFMKFLNELVSNWGLAIILLTLAVKLITFPLTYKSMKSMKQMAKLNPQIQKLREKYGNDKEALNREMMLLMRTQGYNPLAGCLPILIQMPVFFALYRVLYSSTELYQAPFMFWIQDLSAKDPLYITPIILTAVMFVQQKLTPNTASDPMQAKLLLWMPVIFGVFMLQLPSGLTLYMLVNALAGIVQQLVLNRKLEMGNAATAS
jgi:YidC/Oxa1 family membrane protein insertase